MASDFAIAANKVRDLKDDLEDGIEDSTEEAMGDMKQEVILTLASNGSVARPELSTDVRENRKPAPQAITRRAVHVPNWAKYVEYGTGSQGEGKFEAPSNPPFRAIRKWAYAKPIVPENGRSIYQASAAIAQSIADQGTEAHPFLRPTWRGERGYLNVIYEIRSEMRKILRSF
jgi:hypothetical protein